MTINTFDAHWLKFKQGRRLMALLAIGFVMSTNQWESAQLVNLRNIMNQPGIWVVAPVTIESDCIIVQIGMTIDTTGFGIAEHEGYVTCPAISIQVLTVKDEACSFMAE
ncbi:MAG TPA: hypothetical protein DCY35_01690 [Prolixibacteraceae bacterium]|nr:hypothetical protein [Prolixibacteraceae bacterium]